MANAQVDKLKEIGIRHGEKAVVGLTAAAFVALTLVAITKPVLEMKPADLNKTVGDAEKNLSRPQKDQDILAKLERDGLKDPDFQKVVDNQIANALKPADYRTRLAWVTPEPGAGLIRDQPELIAPTDLAAFPGRGGVLLYALDENGERKRLSPEEIEKANKGSRRAGGGGDPRSGGGGDPRSGGGRPKKKDDKESPEDKAKRLLEEQNRLRAFAGKKAEPGKDAAKEEETAEPENAYVEETKGKRWIVITGVLDNEKLRKNYFQALKQDALAYPNFKRLDVERRTIGPDGTPTDWAMVEQEKNWQVIDNEPESDEEFVPETKRPSALVDPLPLLKAGYWTGVHVARLVPPEILEPSKDANNSGPGGMGRGGKGMGMPGMPMGGPPPPGGGGPGGKGMGMGMGVPGMPMGGGPGGKMMGDGGPGMPGSPGGPAEPVFTKYDDPELMIRSLDFTIEPNATYQYRVRIVVYNPNKDHTDVNPGVDTTSKTLLGPWSKPTNVVHVPADVATYAQAPEVMGRRTDAVNFQVVKWDPATGQTVIKNDIVAPGELIGQYDSVAMPPIEDEEELKSANIEFNSRAFVLDTVGGRQKLPDIGLERVNFEVPALAMVIEPDGSVVVRSQGRDKTDDVRKDMEANYKLAIDEAKDNGKKKKKGGSRAPGGGSVQPNGGGGGGGGSVRPGGGKGGGKGMSR